MATSISRSGGYEGSNEFLSLDGTMGSQLTYYFQHYSIPDRFIIRYQGQTLFDSGFTGGSQSGTVFIPAGTSDQVNVIIATDDAGTAWDYNVSVEEQCKDTAPLVVTAIGGDFEDPDGDGICTYTGDVLISVEGGAFQLRVNGTTASLGDDSVTLAGGTFVAGGTQIFAGSATITYEDQSDDAVEDGGQATYMLAGTVPVDLFGMRVTQTDLRFGFALKLPDELGGITVDNPSPFGAKALIFDGSTVRLGLSGTIELPNLEDYKFFDFFSVSMEDVKLSYSGTENQFGLTGKMTVETETKGLPSFELDLTEGDGITYGPNGDWDFEGKLKAETDFSIGKWGFTGFEFGVNTAAKELSLSGSIQFPFKGRTPEATLNGDFVYGPFALNGVGIEIDDINLPVWQGVYLQSLRGSVAHMAAADDDPVAFSGGVGVSFGPAVGQYKLATGELDMTIDEDSLTGDGKLKLFVDGDDSFVSQTGTSKIDWTAKQIELDGMLSVNNPLDLAESLMTMSGKLKANSKLDASGSFTGSGELPGFLNWFTGGSTDITGNALVKYVNDNTLSNDYAALWGTVAITGIGNAVVGVKVTFDRDISVIGAESIPSLDDSSRLMLASAEARGVFAIAAAAEVTESFVLDAPRAWLAMHATWEVADADVGIAVINPAGTRIEQVDFAANGITIGIDTAQEVSVIIADAGAGTWQLALTGSTVDLGAITSEALAAAIPLTLDLTLPSADDAASPYDLTWTTTGAMAGDHISFYLDEDGAGFDGVAIALDQDAMAGTWSWDGTGITAGTYHVYAMLDSEAGIPVYDYAPGTFTVSGGADLAVTGTRSGGYVTLDVENLGTSAAADIMLVVTGTPGSSLFIYSGAGTPVDLGNGQWGLTLSDIAAGEQTAVSFYSYSSGDISIVGTTSSIDTNDANDTLELPLPVTTTTPGDPVDLSLTRTVTQPGAQVGDAIAYTVTVTNQGSTDATGVRVYEDQFGLDGSANYYQYYDSTQQRAYYDLGNLAAGALVDITVSGILQRAGGVVVVDEVMSNESELTPGDNHDAFSLRSAAPTAEGIDLSVGLVASAAGAVAGDTVNFTVSVGNVGPGVATGIQVAAKLPEAYAFVSVTGIQGSYDAATGIWDVGNIRDGVTRELVITATATQRGSGAMTAELIAAQEPDADSTPGNGLASEDDQTSITAHVGPNTAPVAAADAYATDTAGRLSIDAASGLLANDSDPEGDGLGAVLVDGPQHGVLTLLADGGFTYQGDATYNGADSFTYRPADFSLEGEAVTVDLQVTNVDPAQLVGIDAFLREGVLDLEGSSWTGPGGPVSFAGTPGARFTDGLVSIDASSDAAVIGRLYEGLLGRQGDANGMSFWLDRAEDGASLASIAGAMARSSEYNAATGGLDDAGFVARIYQNMLDHAPDQATSDALVARLAAGAPRSTVTLEVAASAEAAALPGASEGRFIVDRDMAVASGFYDIALDRAGDQSGLIFWSGQVDLAGSAGLARNFAASAEFTGRMAGLSNGAVVESLYDSAFGREADAAGLAYWTDRLDTGLARSNLLIDLFESAEYQGVLADQTAQGIAFA
jgi:uncharacterized repeat protein (TIGR01451 family)